MHPDDGFLGSYADRIGPPHPLDEIFLTTQVGVVCGADEGDGVTVAQALRKVSRLLLLVREVVVMDGKTLCEDLGSRTEPVR